MLRIISSLVVLVAIGLMPLGGIIDSSVQAAEPPQVREVLAAPEEEYIPDQIIVKFKTGIRSATTAELHKSLGTSVTYTSPYAGFEVLQIPQGKTVAEIVEAYSKQSIVEYAEPNYIRRASWSPNDPLYSVQWHFAQINLEAAWDLDTTAPLYGGDPSIIVAVLDTGVAYENYGGYLEAPDLADTNFVQGWNFVNNNAHPNDDNNHGTHVCGTIAQSTNNSLGVAGIAFNTAIMPVKILDNEGSGTIQQEADGIYYATNNGAKIINMSLGALETSNTERDALAYAYNHGVTIICAAGNHYEEGNAPEYPAAYDDYCIAVGATRYDQTHSYYSNTGSYLDIAAPGGDMTVDQNDDGYSDGVVQQTFAEGDPTDFSYYFLQGTSMACPHVAGVAALILAKHPSFTPDQVRQALESTATDLGATGRDDVYGWGLVNAAAAVSWTPAGAPSVTTNDATSITTTSATLNGTLTSLGSASSVSVSFEWGNTAAYGHETTPQAITAARPFSFNLSGLSPATIYHFRAKAVGDGTAYGSDKSFTTATAVASPDITVSPASFNVTQAPNTTQNYTLTIGNVGNATLTYDISDRTTGGEGVAAFEEQSSDSKIKKHLMESNASRQPMSFPSLSNVLGEIFYDDGVYEDGWYWDYSGGLFAVRFTPTSYPVNLKKARICLYPDWPDSDHEQFAVEVYDDNGVGGAPGTQLGTTVYSTATDWGWQDVNISGLGITITSGDFYIAYKQLTDAPNCEGLCADYTSPDARSWLGDPEYGWWLVEEDEEADALDWMIRCVVEVGAAKNLVSISASPPSISLPVGGTQQLSVIAHYSDGSTADVTHSPNCAFTSGNSAIATVSSPGGGLITGASPGSTTVHVSYTEGDITKTIDVPIVVTPPDDCHWMSENLPSGSVNSGGSTSITVTINTAGLAVGDYHGEIVIANNDSDENPTIVPVTLRVEWSPWVYDTSPADGYIEIGELLVAISDYIGGDINIGNLLDIISLYIGHTHR